ncbi:VWA domain-containing protein [Hoyosella sp. YIM 151337]|uniref:VWA domain-containing protein n=1 Tax=Hoyosella sp. YIM 151337 TaxID=2992742 RepID=UPI0022368326|nr:VWA domain-containing protein [Hoyosella sp. YIM 151337]MCW4352625.1 VWA domain-containing protein [Hoyosella sp. YIM 151337]
MRLEPEPRELLTASDWALCEIWLHGGQYGLLLVGDSWGREHLWRELAAASRHNGNTAELLPAADLVNSDDAAGYTERILAAAPDTESVPPALLRRMTCIIGVRRKSTQKPRRATPTADIALSVVEALEANSLHDHGLDVAAARLVRAVSQARGIQAGIDALYRTVIAPRLHGPSSADSDGTVGRSASSGEEGEQNSSSRDDTRGDEDAANEPLVSGGTDSSAERGTPASGGSDGSWDMAEDQAEREGTAEPGDLVAVPRHISTPEQARLRGQTVDGSARRGPRIHSERGRAGRVVSIERAHGKVAIHPTLVTAARRHAARGREPFQVTRADLRGVLRAGRARTLTIVVVDRSDSMGMLRIRQATALASDALERAYLDRSDVAVISARGAKAQLVLPPTRGLLRAHRVLTRLPSGGGTPLASAFQLARVVSAPFLARRNVRLRALLVTDGSATVKLDPDETGSAQEHAAEQLMMLTAHMPVEVLPLTHTGACVTDKDLAWLEDAGAVVVRAAHTAQPTAPV